MCAFLYVGPGMCVSILTVSVNKSGTLPFSCFQETFHQGLWYSPQPTPAQKWCSAFVANPCFLNSLHPLGKENTIYRQAWETPWQNRLQTASTGTEMLITSVFFVLFFFFISSLLYPSGRNYGICHCLSFCLGYFLLFCVNVHKFPMGANVKMRSSQRLILTCQGYRTFQSFSLPNNGPPLPFTNSLFALSFSFCPSNSSFSSKLQQNGSSVVSSYALGAKVL